MTTAGSLRTRILVAQSALIVGLSAVTLAYVSVLAEGTVNEAVAADLARSRDGVAAAETERYRRLRLVSELVASFPELRALFTTDAATIRDFLSNFRQRHGREELLIALDAGARVVARTDTFAPLNIPDVQRAWIEPALEGRSSTGHLDIDGRFFHAVLAPAESGGTVFGFIVAAAPIDQAWARSLSEATEKEIVIVGPSSVVGSTLLATNLPWRSTRDLGNATRESEPSEVDVAGEEFQALLAQARPEDPTRVLSLQSRDAAFAPYRNIQLGLLALGFVAAAVGISGSAMLARSITAPVRQLAKATRQVAAGNFDVRLSVERADEIGELARAFNQMTEGLRERADMQKFVSQSTVQMIQRQGAPNLSAGERRSVTLLFSDIRGFTSFAERHSPEEAVAVLNRYLRLQAELVKAFHGDVDKFMGDAVFAHFSGADMALDAIRCAVAMHRAVEAASESDPALPEVSIGIGIATGDVIVGSIGSDDRLDYTAVGPPVNLASRLCAAAEPHEVLLSEETFGRVRDLVAADALAPLTVKGFSAPVTVYRMKVGPAAA